MKIVKFNERGQALIMIALAVVVLFGFAALAIDGSILFSDRRHAQNAADTAALAAGLAKTRGKDYMIAGFDRAKSNGYDNNGTSNIVKIEPTATANGICPEQGLDIKVTITSHVKTTFAQILGWTQLTNVVSSTARACEVAAGKPIYAGSSVWSTKGTVCNGTDSKNLYVGGSGQVQLYGGGFGSASPDTSCIDLSGAQTTFHKQDPNCATLVTAALTTSQVGTGQLGGVEDPDNCLANGGITTSATFKDPPANLNITCGGNASTSGNTMSPGNYSGTFPPSGVTTLNPGTYCINGNFTLNANDKLTGNGVTIVMNTGSLKWNGSSEPQLSAPTSGDYAGLLIYAPPTNSVFNQATQNNEISIEGSGNAKVTGTVLAQNLPCNFAGNSEIQKQTLQFICYTWSMNGSGQAQIVYDSSVFFSPPIPPSVSQLY